MDRAMLPHAKSKMPHCTLIEITRGERYLKHIATQTVTCRLSAHTYTIRPKLHLVDLLSTHYTHIFVTNTAEIKLIELEPYAVVLCTIIACNFCGIIAQLFYMWLPVLACNTLQ